MKKVFLVVCLLVLGLLTIAQKITNFKITVIGDSHTVDTPPGGSDSIWANKIAVFYRQFFDTVTLTNLGQGGLCTRHMMPSWYGGSLPGANVDAALSYNPDLIIICNTGNTTVVLSQPADSSIKHFKYLTDTLRGLNKAFILTGQDARQKTFVFPITAQTYHDTSTRINNWMINYCPKNYANVYTRDYDNVVGLRPWPYVLRDDSLHKSNVGHRLFYQSHLDCWIIDSTLNDFKARIVNITITKVSTNVRIKGTFKYNTLEIYGSNNYSSFVLMDSRVSEDEREDEILNILIPHSGYKYIKVIAIGKRLTKTYTKQIIP